MAWFEELKTPRVKRVIPEERSSKIPDGLWVKCPKCSEVVQTRVLLEARRVCPSCAHHLRLTGDERIALLTDFFEEELSDLQSTDPLSFQDSKMYAVRLKNAQQKTGLQDGFRMGRAVLQNLPFRLGVFEFGFMGGSMGAVVGEKIAALFDRAREERVPAVVVSASGGARMQEGILSLMQMAKTLSALERFREEKLPYISVLTDPTTGGVAASFAMLGDLILAEPGALVGFAGPRVIQQTIRQSLPPGFQTSEFLLEHGFVDRVVPRGELRLELHRYLQRLGQHRCNMTPWGERADSGLSS